MEVNDPHMILLSTYYCPHFVNDLGFATFFVNVFQDNNLAEASSAEAVQAWHYFIPP